MPKCNSCGNFYNFLEDYKGKLIAVDESTMTNSEISAVIGHMKVAFNPAKHKQHIYSCKNNLKVDIRTQKKNSTINKKRMEQNGTGQSDNSQSEFDF